MRDIVGKAVITFQDQRGHWAQASFLLSGARKKHLVLEHAEGFRVIGYAFMRALQGKSLAHVEQMFRGWSRGSQRLPPFTLE